MRAALEESSQTLWVRRHVNQGLRHPHHAKDEDVALRADMCAKFWFIACNERESRFGNENIEFRTQCEGIVFEAAECDRNIGSAVVCELPLGVADYAEVRDH